MLLFVMVVQLSIEYVNIAGDSFIERERRQQNFYAEEMEWLCLFFIHFGQLIIDAIRRDIIIASKDSLSARDL